MTDIVFVDTETTSLALDTEIWEVAMVRRDKNNKELDIVEFQIMVEDLSKADPFALRINKFYDRYNEMHAFTKYEAAQQIVMATRGAHIVGAVPNFDTERMDRLLRAYRFLPDWHYHLIDVETLAIGYLKGLTSESYPYEFKLPWKSDELTKAIGVEPPTEEERHTAMGDVRWAMRIYDKVMGIS